MLRKLVPVILFGGAAMISLGATAAPITNPLYEHIEASDSGDLRALFGVKPC